MISTEVQCGRLEPHGELTYNLDENRGGFGASGSAIKVSDGTFQRYLEIKTAVVFDFLLKKNLVLKNLKL